MIPNKWGISKSEKQEGKGWSESFSSNISVMMNKFGHNC